MVDTPPDNQLRQKILKHVHRYRITTPQVIHRRLFGEQDVSHARRWCQRLRQAGDLTQGWLWHDQPYYALSAKVANEVFQERDFGPFRNAQQLVVPYAMLWLCCLSEGPNRRRKLSTTDLRRLYPDLPLQAAPATHLFLEEGKDRLGWLIVDGGAPKPIKAMRIRNRVYDFVRKRRPHAGWREIIEQDALLLAIATAWETKAAVLRDVLAKHAQPIPYEIHVVHDLRHLIAATPREVTG